MNARKKFKLLTVVLFFGAGVLLLHQYLRFYSSQQHTCSAKSPVSRNITEASDYIYHTYSLTYLEDLNSAEVKMDDPALITAIREKFLMPPLPRSVPYQLKYPNILETSMGQAELIRDILRSESHCFFVEARAFDGETRSNTLAFERRLKWTGLLIEHDPLNFAKLVEKKRKAWLSLSCLSVHPYPHMVSFKQAFDVGKVTKFPTGQTTVGFMDVQCVPLYSLLLALNRTTVDYLSLAVNGNELDVLRTIPFKDISIRTLSVEYLHIWEGKRNLLNYMQRQGYEHHATVHDTTNNAKHFIFFKLRAVPKDYP